jgi:hypothetical protein
MKFAWRCKICSNGEIISVKNGDSFLKTIETMAFDVMAAHKALDLTGCPATENDIEAKIVAEEEGFVSKQGLRLRSAAVYSTYKRLTMK